MAIKIKNLRISPYTDKNELKVIFGDELKLTFEIPHVDGESYLCALDCDRILYPINRPVCAYTEVFTRDGDNVSFTLNLTTSKLRDYVSSIKKPMPVWLQIVREVSGKYETVLLDDILAIPSVIDGSMTVYEGDSFKELLDAKMNVPEAEGTAGQVLTMDADGHYSWQDLPEQEQADWDESDSESPAYIKNKPNLAINDGKITVNQGGVKKGEFTVNQAGDTTIDLNDGAQSDWDESDSSDVSFIKNKPALATVATSGSYNDLTDKPIVTQPVNADWDESDSENLAYIFNKPTIPAAQVQADYAQNDNTQIDYIKNKPEIIDATDYLCFTPIIRIAQDITVTLNAVGNAPNINLEYSKDRHTWTSYTVGTAISLSYISSNKFESVWFRGDNSAMATGWNVCHTFALAGAAFAVTGNIMSLLKKDCKQDAVPTYGFAFLFNGCTTLISAPKLPASVVGSYCYARMFQGCTSLIEAPELPAMTLTQYCYGGMFNGCTALKKAHDLPALNGENTSYGGMFQNCTSLKEAPVINANMYNSCSEYMFDGCTSLNHVKVNFTNFNGATDYWMSSVAASGVFECPSALNISSRGASTVPAGWTIVRTDAPQSDWNQTDSTEASFIKNKPTIPDAQVQADWDESDSSDVSFILNKPDLATDENDYLCFTALAANSTVSMRRSKSRSGDNPENKDIEYSTDKKTWSQYQWNNQWNDQIDSGTVITLANIGDKVWFRGNNARWNYQVQIGIGAYIVYKFYFAMSGTIGASGDVVYLASKKGDVKKAINLNSLFRDCTSLVTSPKLGFTELLEECYNRLFFGCTNLKEVTELKAIKMEKLCYYALFSGCTSLQYPPALPSVQLAERCYANMFQNCTSLKLAPELPASNLVSQCYNRMFEGCTLIDHLKVGFSDWAITGSVESSYKTYNWLSNVSATGVLECPATLDTSTRDTSHIPSGWTVVWTTSVQSDWSQTDNTEASYIQNRNISAETTSSDATYTVNAGDATTPVLTVASALTLSAGAVASGKIAYAEVVLDIAAGATVTAGTNITFVDTPTAGKRNVCVVRWADGTAKLYVTITEDLDASSSI